ncbi:MAG: ferredoxin family protein [Dehalococcoidia bacterium]
MAYVITSTCIDVKDTACQDVCPVDCIYFDPDEDRMLFIHPDECIDCAACEPVCPVTAIFSGDDVPTGEREHIDLSARYFQNKEAVRQRVNEIAAEKK